MRSIGLAYSMAGGLSALVSPFTSSIAGDVMSATFSALGAPTVVAIGTVMAMIVFQQAFGAMIGGKEDLVTSIVPLNGGVPRLQRNDPTARNSLFGVMP